MCLEFIGPDSKGLPKALIVREIFKRSSNFLTLNNFHEFGNNLK